MDIFNPASFIYSIFPDRESLFRCFNLKCRSVYRFPLEINIDTIDRTAFWPCGLCGSVYDYSKVGFYPTTFKIIRQRCYWSQARGKATIDRILKKYYLGQKLIIPNYIGDPNKIYFTQAKRAHVDYDDDYGLSNNSRVG